MTQARARKREAKLQVEPSQTLLCVFPWAHFLPQLGGTSSIATTLGKRPTKHQTNKTRSGIKRQPRSLPCGPGFKLQTPSRVLSQLASICTSFDSVSWWQKNPENPCPVQHFSSQTQYIRGTELYGCINYTKIFPRSHCVGSLDHELILESLDTLTIAALRSSENPVSNQVVRMMSEPKKMDDIGSRSNPSDKLNQAHN